MQKFENCVLLTRVGGFYELYFKHAEEYGPLLNLKVAQKKTAAGPVSMVIVYSSAASESYKFPREKNKPPLTCHVGRLSFLPTGPFP
jgi:DNA mismatch repair ATPase MutS